MSERITIRELVVKLLFEGSESGVTKFNQALQAFSQLAGYADKALDLLKDTVVGTTLEVAAMGDTVAKHAAQVGLAVDQYDALTAAIQFAGGSAPDLDIGIKTLTRTVEEFVRTGKGAGEQAFKAFLGPDARKTLAGIDDIGDALPLLADGFASIQDPIERAAMLQRIFGESGSKLIPLLSGGAAGLQALAADAGRAGVFSEHLARSSEALQDNLLRLSLRGRGLKLALGEETVPALKDLTDELVLASDALRKLVDPALRAGARLLADGFRQLRDWSRALRTEVAESVRGVAALKTALIFLTAVAGILVAQALPGLVLWLGKTALAAARAGAQMLLAWAKAALPLVLLAALITAIVLVVEDLYVAVTGGESAIKGWTDSLIEAGGAGEVFARSVQWLFMGGLGNDLYDLFEDLGAWLDEFGAALALLPESLRDAFTSAIDWLLGRLGDVRKYFGELFELPDWLKSGLKSAASFATGGLYAPPSAAVGGSGGRTSNVSVGGSSVSVAVNGAGDPRAVGAEVARQVDDAVSRHATRAARDLGAVMQY